MVTFAFDLSTQEEEAGSLPGLQIKFQANWHYLARPSLKTKEKCIRRQFNFECLGKQNIFYSFMLLHLANTKVGLPRLIYRYIFSLVQYTRGKLRS